MAINMHKDIRVIEVTELSFVLKTNSEAILEIRESSDLGNKLVANTDLPAYSDTSTSGYSDNLFSVTLFPCPNGVTVSGDLCIWLI